MRFAFRLLTLSTVLAWASCSEPAAPTPEKTIPVTTDSDEAREAFLKGRDLSERLLGVEAHEYFSKAVEKDPNFAIAYMYKGQSSASTRQFFADLEKAVSLVDQVSEGERLWILGLQAGINGDANARGEHYQKLVAAYPEDARAHDLLAGHYAAIQDSEGAIREYQAATSLEPNRAPSYNSLGYALRNAKRYDEAQKAFERYIELIPDDPNPYDSYAELLMKMGRFDESIANYKKALQKDATFPGSQMGIAANLMFQGKHDEAIEWLQQYHDQARDDGERRQALYGIAVIYVDQGDLAKAHEVIDSAVAASEKAGEKAQLATDAANKATLLCFAGKADEAAAYFEESNALIADSNLSDTIKQNAKWGQHGNQALVALARSDLETARSEAEEFAARAKAARNPGQIRFAHELAGRIALAAEDYETAIQELSQANQQSPFVLFQLAKANCGAGNEQKCKELASEVVNYNTLPTLRYALVRQEAADLVK